MKKKLVKPTKHEGLTLIIEQDRSEDYCTTPTARKMLVGFKDQLSPELWDYLIGMLQGFTKEMQIIIANSIHDFVSLKIVHMTGFPSIDTVLFACYEQIAQEMGYKLTDMQYLID